MKSGHLEDTKSYFKVTQWLWILHLSTLGYILLPGNPFLTIDISTTIIYDHVLIFLKLCMWVWFWSFILINFLSQCPQSVVWSLITCWIFFFLPLIKAELCFGSSRLHRSKSPTELRERPPSGHNVHRTQEETRFSVLFNWRNVTINFSFTSLQNLINSQRNNCDHTSYCTSVCWTVLCQLDTS